MNKLKLPRKLFSHDIRFPLVLIGILSGAFFLSKIIVTPEPRVIAVGLLCFAALILAFIRQEYVVYPAIFLLFFHDRIAVFYNTNNAIIIALSIFLFIRYVIESESVISLSTIIHNPFWMVSIVIFSSYLVSWFMAWHNQSFGLHFHTRYLVGIFSALLMGNLLIGFVQNDPRRSFIVQQMLLMLLVCNLLVGLLSWFDPDHGLAKMLIKAATGREQSGVVFAGSGDDFAMRLGGLTLFWEAYAEYLMMAVIVLTGCYISLKDRGKLLKAGIGILLLLSFFELLLTNTRGATVLAAVGVITIIFVYADLTLTSRIAAFVAIGIVCSLILWLAISSGQFTLFERFSSFADVEKTEFGYLPTGRAMVWLPSLRHIAQAGIFGSGPSYLPLTHWDGIGGLSWPHNLILFILSTIGVVGLGAYSFLIYRLFKIRKAIAVTVDNNQYYFFKYLWIALIFFFVDTMKFDGFLRMTENYFYYIWIIIAYMFSVLNFGSIKNNYN